MILCKQCVSFLVQVKHRLQKAFVFTYCQLFYRMNFFERNENLFQKVQSSLKCREEKENFHTILLIIFWNFTTFQQRPSHLQVNQNVVSSTVNLVYEMSHELSNDIRLRIQEIRNNQQNNKFGRRHSLVSNLLSRNEAFAIAVQKHARVYIKKFLTCPVLLQFSILRQIF